MKKNAHFFVSYAHRNAQLASGFLERLNDVLIPSKHYQYKLWSDHGILVGEDWDSQIKQAMQVCDVGLLLISPSFLASSYITETELPSLLSSEKKLIPVMLQPIDMQRHDLKGLEKKQIFRLDYEGFKEPRAYGDCKGPRRDSFVLSLFAQIEAALDKSLT